MPMIVIPACAGMDGINHWIPACAGMTAKGFRLLSGSYVLPRRLEQTAEESDDEVPRETLIQSGFL